MSTATMPNGKPTTPAAASAPAQAAPVNRIPPAKRGIRTLPAPTTTTERLTILTTGASTTNGALKAPLWSEISPSTGKPTVKYATAKFPGCGGLSGRELVRAAAAMGDETPITVNIPEIPYGSGKVKLERIMSAERIAVAFTFLLGTMHDLPESMDDDAIIAHLVACGVSEDRIIAHLEPDVK